MKQNEQHSYWRSDVTGLRALAVLPVLIFHAWPTLLPGGFVGVDVFFVISGYLISGILFRQLQRTGSVDFLDFYDKRIRRIIPNLLCILLFTIAVGWILLTPSEYSKLGRQVYSSVFFYQNFRLLKDSGDYFATDATLQPLLHLWSLSIEEQFYIVFPLLCAIVWKVHANVRVLGVTVLFITVGSLLACLLTEDQSFRFYFPFTRFWELGVGILLSYAQHFGFWQPETQSRLKYNAISLLGGGILIASLFTVREHNFPGLGALMPTIGAVLILSASPKAIFNRFLALSPIVFIGLISYSLYLWHWPLLAYANVIYPLHETWINGILLLVGFVLSVFSYRFIETPARTVKTKKSKKLVVVGLLGGVVVAVAIGQAVRLSDGLPQRSDVFYKHAMLKSDWSNPKAFYEKAVWNGAELYVNKPNVFPEILFIGDSHMEQYSVRIKKLADQRGISVGLLMDHGCFVAPGVMAADSTCAKRNKDFLKLFDDPRLKAVVMGEIWGAHMLDTKKFRVEHAGEVVSFSDGGLELALKNVAEKFSARRDQVKLFVLLDAPWDTSTYDPMRRINRLNTAPLKWEDFEVDLPKEDLWKRGNELVKKVLDPVGKLIDPTPQVCPNDRCNLLKYKDDDHLRSSYTEREAIWIDSIFDDVEKLSKDEVAFSVES